jgi:hypothetical protein
MSLKDQIAMFLKDPEQYDFSFGLELYHTAGPGPDWSYLKQFKYSSPGDQVKKKLVDGLRDLFEVMEPAGDHREDPAGTIHHDQVQPVQLEPQVIRQFRQEQKTLLKRRDKVHAELCLIAQQPESQQREKELYERAQNLMSNIIPQLDRVYASIQGFEKEGKLPPADENKDLALYKKLNSLRSSLSRFRKLQRANKDKVKAQYYEHKILTIQTKIEAIKEEISRL